MNQGKVYRKRLAKLLLVAGATVLGAGGLPSAMGSELVFQFINPSFGGNPAYGPGLMESALITRKHKAPDIDSDRFGIEDRTPGEQLNEAIERNIISRISMAVSAKIMDADGNFIPGELTTDNYFIVIEDLLNGKLKITTTDRSTGSVTEFTVSQ